MATRSAMRAGWLTGGVMLKIARADVDPLGAARRRSQEDLVGREVRVLVEEVVLGTHSVLAAGRIARIRHLELAHQADVLGVDRIGLQLVLRHVCLNE